MMCFEKHYKNIDIVRTPWTRYAIKGCLWRIARHGRGFAMRLAPIPGVRWQLFLSLGYRRVSVCKWLFGVKCMMRPATRGRRPFTSPPCRGWSPPGGPCGRGSSPGSSSRPCGGPGPRGLSPRARSPRLLPANTQKPKIHGLIYSILWAWGLRDKETRYVQNNLQIPAEYLFWLFYYTNWTFFF